MQIRAHNAAACLAPNRIKPSERELVIAHAERFQRFAWHYFAHADVATDEFAHQFFLDTIASDYLHECTAGAEGEEDIPMARPKRTRKRRPDDAETRPARKQQAKDEPEPTTPRPPTTAASHLETIEVFRKAIASTGAELTSPDPQGQLLHRFNEHVCRVSGSQFLTRLGYPLETVQLIGRWGSDAVRRYVQEAPLSCASGSPARPCINRTPTQRTVRTMVKKYLETITSKFWVKNTSTNVIHISGAPEFFTENIHWQWLALRPSTTHQVLVPPRGQSVPEMLSHAGEPGHHGRQQR